MSEPRRFLRFTAGGLEVMVAASAFRRALPAPLPLPAEVELDGEAYPVADLGALAGTAPGGPPPALLLVLADDAVRLVVPATEVSGTVFAELGELAPLPWPWDGSADWCAGVRAPEREGGRPVLALDLAGLVEAATAGAALAREAVP